MPATKIQDETEVRRWFDEGRTYQWMADEYLRKYRLEMSQSAFSNLRRRRGWERRIARNDDLIPWEVNIEHRWAFVIRMLRFEGRVRSGKEVSREDQHVLTIWKSNLRARGEVVHYDPNTAKGFQYVKRGPDDGDLIREPSRKTTKRRSADR
ncbi:hypothetical protein [Humibacillus xanthopallidus]|uniref:Immunity repressor n=1 Tax=Humibacillus xanthopallidus TaxID=412689 RepID=A0A543HZW3_9MICO|nr:hypothetical protein [Humibacillus xanthopallidus]TQM63820.1 hypothetical protein FBY41_0173 [Humibacillus xanthopallidus]